MFLSQRNETCIVYIALSEKCGQLDMTMMDVIIPTFSFWTRTAFYIFAGIQVQFVYPLWLDLLLNMVYNSETS